MTIYEKVSYWLERVVNDLFIDVIKFSQCPQIMLLSAKSDPLLINFVYYKVMHPKMYSGWQTEQRP